MATMKNKSIITIILTVTKQYSRHVMKVNVLLKSLTINKLVRDIYMPQFGIFTIFRRNHDSHRTFVFFLCHLPAHRNEFGVT